MINVIPYIIPVSGRNQLLSLIVLIRLCKTVNITLVLAVWFDCVSPNYKIQVELTVLLTTGHTESQLQTRYFSPSTSIRN